MWVGGAPPGPRNPRLSPPPASLAGQIHPHQLRRCRVHRGRQHRDLYPLTAPRGRPGRGRAAAAIEGGPQGLTAYRKQGSPLAQNPGCLLPTLCLRFPLCRRGGTLEPQEGAGAAFPRWGRTAGPPVAFKRMPSQPRLGEHRETVQPKRKACGGRHRLPGPWPRGVTWDMLNPQAFQHTRKAFYQLHSSEIRRPGFLLGAGHVGTACPARTQISESGKANRCSVESMLVYTNSLCAGSPCCRPPEVQIPRHQPKTGLASLLTPPKLCPTFSTCARNAP